MLLQPPLFAERWARPTVPRLAAPCFGAVATPVGYALGTSLLSFHSACAGAPQSNDEDYAAVSIRFARGCRRQPGTASSQDSVLIVMLRRSHPLALPLPPIWFAHDQLGLGNRQHSIPACCWVISFGRTFAGCTAFTAALVFVVAAGMTQHSVSFDPKSPCQSFHLSKACATGDVNRSGRSSHAAAVLRNPPGSALWSSLFRFFWTTLAFFSAEPLWVWVRVLAGTSESSARRCAGRSVCRRQAANMLTSNGYISLGMATCVVYLLLWGEEACSSSTFFHLCRAGRRVVVLVWAADDAM